ncbi:hypothetical protein RN001_012249 [Aquatica leii]|uniref:RING-CH-type domain-containing protein n=1 Tax=Aquatica leii TaxID=1421715 RepID=A0AAN7PU52_9COLE|nr:hypothetical protein RN001_012249 [Aquatica leii]
MSKSNQQKPSGSHSAIKSLERKKSTIITVDPDKSSIISIVCRICYDGDKDEPIITPCRCKGTVAFVHRTCLETWLAESNSTSCELCHYVYRTERTPKYTARESIGRWFRNHPQNPGFPIRGLRNDLYACAILTPLAIIITYICLFSADYYNQKKFANIPAAKWTSVSLLVMISIMIIGYYLWVYMIIRYHGRAWYYCWQRECVVRYIPPSTQSVCFRNDCNYIEVQTTPNNEEANVNDLEQIHTLNDIIPEPVATTIEENLDIPLEVITSSENAENVDDTTVQDTLV